MERLNKRWEIAPKIPAEVAAELAEYKPVMQQLLYNRGIRDEIGAYNFLVGEGSMFDPFLMKGMEKSVDRLLFAIDHGEPVVVYGDYDVDGVTATSLLVQAIRRLGGIGSGFIPNRFEEGYGLTFDALDHLSQWGARLIVTVDCGIRSPAETAHARKLGMDIIITDHHEPKDVLPEALAVICPKQAGDEYPDKNLAGVGLAYKLAEGLFKQRPVSDVDPADWTDLVAVGTVADIVPLNGENRALVRAGLKRINRWRRQGLLSLAGAAGLEPTKRVTARDIGFVLGPRLNAAGRMESALAAYNLLMESDVNRAGDLAMKLNSQNNERQAKTREMQQQAENLMSGLDQDFLVFAVHPEFNKGVVGLVAARLVETYYRPAVVGQQEGDTTRASCRSIPEFHITHALDECSDLLERHGGHAMAAGFTVLNHNLPALEQRLKEIARRELADRDLRPTIRADMEIRLQDLKPDILLDLDWIEPTGLTNPEALFVSRNLQVARYKKIGSESQHLRLTVTDGRISYDCVAFRQGAWADSMPQRVDLLYSFEKNTYLGRENLQLNVKDIHPSDSLG